MARNINKNKYMKIHPKTLNTHILNSCFSKRVYESEHAAQAEAKRIAEYKASKLEEKSGRKVWPRAMQMEPYQCGFCKKYHLTTKDLKHQIISPDKIKLRDTNKHRVKNKIKLKKNKKNLKK